MSPVAPRRQALAGFTLAELLIVTLIGSVILMAALQVIITQTRQYSVQSERLQVGGNLRAGAAKSR